LINSGQGAAQPNISQTVLKHLIVDLPPLSLQNEIVAKVDELMLLCDTLEVSMNSKTAIESAFANASSQLLVV
jgi:type I restriction enzyme S subunit